MKNRKTHHNDVNQQVLDVLMKRVAPGVPVNDAMWDVAYDIVWTLAAIDTQSWKAQYISESVATRFRS